MTLKDTESILEYWFGTLQGPTAFPTDRKKLWWMGGEEIDSEILSRFGPLVRAACEGGLEEWRRSARSSLALVILLDQFTRSIYRRRPEAFSGDARAQSVVLEGIAAGRDTSLRPIERSFFYMPLMHAEDAELAQKSLAMYKHLSDEIKKTCPEDHPDSQSHAKSHADIVLRFGRYPHRNAILGRDSTPEELDYLAGNAPRFGQ
ncbi:MAG: DUF924 family protein [Myxococcota bacterium]